MNLAALVFLACLLIAILVVDVKRARLRKANAQLREDIAAERQRLDAEARWLSAETERLRAVLKVERVRIEARLRLAAEHGDKWAAATLAELTAEDDAAGAKS